MENLRDLIEVDPSGCWLWTGYIHPSGYGRVWWRGQKHYAHRAVFLDNGGVIPDGLELDHLCRVRRCVNPAHLEAVTRSENVRRGLAGEVVAKTQRAKTHCLNGHEFTDENTTVTKQGWRSCRECHRVWSRDWKRRRREAAA